MLNSVLYAAMDGAESADWRNLSSMESMWPHLNATFIGHAVDNSTIPRQALSSTCTTIIRITYAIGIMGNLAAIITLCRGDKKIRNRKHALMLRSLAINDLVALVGMMGLMTLQSFLPLVVETRWFCALRVVLRIFGMGSVCIAIVMALERWLALTQPFLYQKHVTYYVVRKALVVLWAAAALLTCLPFLGFGIYYGQGRCLRYRDATDPVHVAYAYVILTFGTLLCVCLVWCNLAVIRVLCQSSYRGGGDQRLLVRRISRTSSKGKPLAATNLNEPIVYNTATADEIAFSKLMATLSVCFIICWMPQMISIFLAQMHPAKDRPLMHRIVFQVADLLMLLNYTLDPYIYVLLRGNSKPFPKCIKSIFRSRLFGKRCTNHQDSLRLASHQDGLTATTTIDITPPATAMNSPPWPKSLPTISSSDSLQSPITSKKSFAPITSKNSPIIIKKPYSPNAPVGQRSQIKESDLNNDSIRNALNCLIKKPSDSPSLV